MDLNYTKIKLGNWLFKNCFPLYNFSYSRFKLKNDAFEIEILKKTIQPGSYVLDIGANIGFYSKILSSVVGEKGRIFCFEPDEVNFGYLKKNTAQLKNVELFNNAVSDKKDVIKVYKSKMLNVDHRTYPVDDYESVEEINAVSIDDLIAEKKIPRVDVIKIDIQGYELFAFKGMLNLLKSNKDLKIVAEYWPHGFKKAGYSAVEFYRFFTDLNYKFSTIENNQVLPLTEKYIADNNDQPYEFFFNVLIERV
ncbi:MAG TPA: FkbM family methyltransferase [Bacteroidia bacterium]|nr:FkbM family methyltransferase [Bacteroidia bacterium]